MKIFMLFGELSDNYYTSLKRVSLAQTVFLFIVLRITHPTQGRISNETSFHLVDLINYFGQNQGFEILFKSLSKNRSIIEFQILRNLILSFAKVK